MAFYELYSPFSSFCTLTVLVSATLLGNKLNENKRRRGYYDIKTKLYTSIRCSITEQFLIVVIFAVDAQKIK